MSTEREAIDICIPCLDGKGVIEDSIRSCVSKLHDVRFVVGLNACTDGTRSFLESLQLSNVIIVDFATRVDMAENWIRTLRYCDSKYVKLLPAGDKLKPGALDHQVAVLSRPEFLDVGLVASRKQILHSIEAIEWIVNLGLHSEATMQTISLSALLEQMGRYPHNILGEPGCILFRHSLVTSLLNRCDAFLSLGRQYPYVTDVIMYVEALNGSSELTRCVIDSQTVCSFEISRSSGSWKLRKRQYSDLLGYCSHLGLRIGHWSKALAKLNSIIRRIIYALAV